MNANAARPTALIAEDEPLLAQALQRELARAWPELVIAGIAGNGIAAVEQALALQPDVLFFDVRMPGQDGLEAATQLADEWPEARPFPLLVFVTAYDQYAIAAFEAQAVDYLLKPVEPQRLARSVERLRALLAARAQAVPDERLQAAVAQLRGLLAHDPAAAKAEPALEFLQAGVGNEIRMVPLSEVLVFEAADKYVRMLTVDAEHLLRTPLKELLPRLDAARFWQVHRGTVVRASAIESVHRDANGRLHLTLRGRRERLAVSRMYAHRFRPM